jgi:hypothetical protein
MQSDSKLLPGFPWPIILNRKQQNKTVYEKINALVDVVYLSAILVLYIVKIFESQFYFE